MSPDNTSLSSNTELNIYTDLERVKQDFARLGPWISGFRINNEWYGGEYHPLEDGRLDIFLQHFPYVKSVVEIGCLEGGHTTGLLLRGVRDIICYEGRAKNIEKAKFIVELAKLGGAAYGADVQFVQADVDTYAFTENKYFGRTVFCVGVLYHLVNPGRFLQQMAAITDNIFLWTHYHAKTSTYVPDGGIDVPTSGLSHKGLWLSKPALLNLIAKCGFRIIFQQDEANKNGPAITLVLKK